MKKLISHSEHFRVLLISILLAVVITITPLPYGIFAQSIDDIPDQSFLQINQVPSLELPKPSITNITNTSVTLNTKLTGLGSAKIVYILFEYGEDTTYSNVTSLQKATSTGIFSLNITRLKPNTKYYFRARAIGSSGGAYSSGGTFTTLTGSEKTAKPQIKLPASEMYPDKLAISKTSADIRPDADTQIKSPDEKISILMPKNAVAEAARVEFSQLAAGGSAGMKILNLFELNASAISSGSTITKFSQNLQITIKHEDYDLAGIDANSLHLYYLDENTHIWIPVDSTYDTKTKTLTATVNHFSIFGEQANPLKSGPGLIHAFQNDLQSGAATGNYPIELPPGTGGFQPSIELKYNSGSVDEMKNKRDVGSWVGIGWSLNLGYISYDEANNRYSLVLNGVGYDLVQGAGYDYYTKPDQFFKITRNGNQWDVYDKNGTYYRFGGTNDSQQYHNNTSYYRWDLSRMQNTNDNIIDIVYTQDVWNNTVRSAYPSIVKYSNDNVRVYFNSSFDYTDSDGNMRYDTPKGEAMNPAPPIVENKRLDSIEVKIYSNDEWQLIRKYYFDYEYDEAVYSEQYGGIWYAGTYTLETITQKDCDDSLSLPVTTFTYENKPIYINDTAMAEYYGNPGNPASFNWPYLTELDNGYGGITTYTYSEIPDNSISPISDVWSREVVTQKEIDSGIEPSVITYYSYNYYPEYIISDSNDLGAIYRGFPQVEETDADGNYIIHYFYTIDANDGDAEKLTGLEYKTEWYDSDDNLLRKVENEYQWDYTVQAYDFVREWGIINPLEYPSGVSISNDGFIYVLDELRSCVRKFDNFGSLVATFGSYGSGTGQLNKPEGITIDGDGFIYISDTNNHRIQKFTSTGILITDWGTLGSGNGQFVYPCGIIADNNGYIYVVDAGNDRIQKFTDAGSFVTKWGSYGTNDGQFIDPSGIALDSNNYVYVADTGNDRIQKFTNAGSFVVKWGSYGTGDGQFSNPSGIALDSSDYVYVTDGSNCRIQKFTNAGSFVVKWGSYGTGDGQLYCPFAITTDDNGYVYVADSGNNRIQVFTDTGTFVTKFEGSEGEEGQFWGPYGITIDDSGYIYVADCGNNRIQKFTSTGGFVATWGTSGDDDCEFNGPTGIAVDDNGYVYVIDCGNNRIQKFTNTGTFVTKWGSYGTGDGQFRYPYGIAVDSSGYIYVIDTNNNRVQKFTNTGTFVTKWGSYGTGDGQFHSPRGIAVDSSGYIYVIDTNNNRVQKFTNTGTFVTKWGTQGSDSGQLNYPYDIIIDSINDTFVADTYNDRIQKFSDNGSFTTKWGESGTGDIEFNRPYDIGIDDAGYVYVADSYNNRIQKFTRDYSILLVEIIKYDYIPGNPNSNYMTSRTRLEYDNYGNIITEYVDGHLSTNSDDATIWRVFYPNTDDNILNKPVRERVYSGIQESDNGGEYLYKEALFYYDGHNDEQQYSPLTTAPDKGNLTRIEQKIDTSNSIDFYFEYDNYGNKISETDPNGNTTETEYDTNYNTYPETKTYPIEGLSESFTYDPGTTNLLNQTGLNGQTTSYEYDTFKRLIKTIKPGDSSQSPSIQYQYNNWGTLNSQHIKTITKVDVTHSIWQAQYFDGLGRVIQTQTQSETGHTLISSTTAYNNCGQVSKQYVSLDVASVITTYQTPDVSWKYMSYSYDGLGRVTNQVNADGTTVSTDYSIPWQATSTDALEHEKIYYNDAFQRLVRIEELDDSQEVYSTMTYNYDVLGNLIEVSDNADNTTEMAYDWLSRKTAMSDPDMGDWSYEYDDNGNITSQTDAKDQTISMTYDELNRLTAKTYPEGSGMTDVAYTYDSTTDGNFGKGLRTGMSDAMSDTNHPSTYKYDVRGHLVEEIRWVYNNDNWESYTTSYTYDGADRIVTITYPNGETVTNGYNDSGLPYSVSGTTAGNLVTSTLYNGLGQISEINLNNTLKTTYGYYGTGGTYDTTGGYYSKLWEIKTLPQGGGAARQDIQYSWDANGNMNTRVDVLTSQTEMFSYDFMDRLYYVAGAYPQFYLYDEIGNITYNNSTYYYSDNDHVHAVTSVGGTSYTYDANGNMTTRGNQTITWDVENHVTAVTGGATFVYDGDGNRVKKTEGGQTVLYINRYYEKNLTTSIVTTNYYLGGQLIANREGTTLIYIHQDSLSSTSVTTSSNGTVVSSIKYFPFGSTRSGSVSTPEKFTGQRLDSTGLYYYGARYYDPTIGRFISPDSIIPDPANTQAFNRYSYAFNNPLKYIDPSGHDPMSDTWIGGFEINGRLVTATINDSGSYDISWDEPEENAICSASEVEYLEDFYELVDPAPGHERGAPNPITYSNISSGTTGGGINITVGFGVGISIDIGVVTDTQGNSGTILSLSFGGSTPTVNINGFSQSTTAQNINDLSSWSGAVGASAGYGSLSVGGEYIGSSLGESHWTGKNKQAGVGFGFPAEVHGFFSFSWILPGVIQPMPIMPIFFPSMLFR